MFGSGIDMEFGSQRALLMDPTLTDTYRVRHKAPTIFLIGTEPIKDINPAKIRPVAPLH
jgi:hypothetical protein